MERGRRFLLLGTLLIGFLPGLASAQVVINEVMYNPQGSDTGREWVELYNEGQADVTMIGGSGKGSWRINDGSNHTLTDPVSGTGRGSLTIPAGGFLIIANDPNDFISGEYAGGTYSVVKASLTLNNNGATVTLLDGTGATVDTVAYSPSQGGNDDGSSLQRQADGSWLAALPTPGAENSSTAYVAPPAQTAASQESNASTTSETQSQQAQSSYVPPPAPNVYADAGSDRTVIVGADTEFDASAYDKTQTLLDPGAVRFMWNFGDGSTAEGDSVLHHFSYPGEYAVVLEIANNRNAAEAQIAVVAQPAALSLSLLPDGGMRIQNLAGRELDLSGWVVRENGGPFAAQFILPGDSRTLPGSSLQLPPSTLSFRASSSTVLEYPNGAPALVVGNYSASTTPSISQSANAASPVAKSVEAPPAVSSTRNKQAVSLTATVDPPDDALDPASGGDDFSEAAPTTTILQSASSASTPLSAYLWWFGVAALAGAIASAALAAGHFKKGEWDVVEEPGD